MTPIPSTYLDYLKYRYKNNEVQIRYFLISYFPAVKKIVTFWQKLSNDYDMI